MSTILNTAQCTMMSNDKCSISHNNQQAPDKQLTYLLTESCNNYSNTNNSQENNRMNYSSSTATQYQVYHCHEMNTADNSTCCTSVELRMLNDDNDSWHASTAIDIFSLYSEARPWRRQ